MTAPRLEINLDKIHHNARALVEALARRSISVTGVTKAMLGSPDIARTLVDAGITAVGDSRIENIQAMRCSRVPAPMMYSVSNAESGEPGCTALRHELQHRA